MKKWTAKLLIVSLLLLQILFLASCDETAAPPTSGNQPTVITPSSDNTPSTPDPSTDNNNTGDNGGEPTPEPAPEPNEIKNIILIIGDGMGLDHIALGQLMYARSFGFTKWQYTVANTDSVDSSGMIDKSGKTTITTDSAAAGTALATGKLTVNGYIGKDHTGADVTTILDAAKALGKSTGVLSTDTLYGATPAAFSAHSISRNNTTEIVLSQLTSNVDLLAGHIDSNCTSQRTRIEANGYAYCDDFANVDDTMTADKAYWQIDVGGSTSTASSATVALKDAAVQALTFLDRDEDGFALMIEQAHIDKYAHANDVRGTAWAARSLNDTVEAILAWLGDRTDTAIVVTSDHETGGLSVGLEQRYDESLRAITADADGRRQLIYYNFSSTGHTNAKVGVFVYGIDADFAPFSYYGSNHTIKNTDVYDLLADVLAKPKEYGERAA